ncbi:hypothetical protein [Rhodococcus erythropolis]|uniref:hypothetical protein n=1 Tax=Rhodococcus erythropolis TaxID=1833 RepID=UPI001BE94D5F|nr:hypothetical protein [Rhodococcus erythropolis]MBT2268798.1 hypothetical protein [Rhodococcus erythropolis]
MSAWTNMGAGVHCAPTGVLYVDGKELGWIPATNSYGVDEFGELNRLLDRAEAEADAEFNRDHTECTWTAPKSQTIVLDIHEIGSELWLLLAARQLDQALLLESNRLAPPKRPPDPERPFWAVRPDRMRRNAIKQTRRVK